jgi:hypothetical protein
MVYLDRESALKALKEHKAKLEKEITQREKMCSEDEQNGAYYSNLIAVEHALDMLKVDLKAVKAILQKAESDQDWNLTPIPFWRNQVTGDDKTEYKV